MNALPTLGILVLILGWFWFCLWAADGCPDATSRHEGNLTDTQCAAIADAITRTDTAWTDWDTWDTELLS